MIAATPAVLMIFFAIRLDLGTLASSASAAVIPGLRLSQIDRAQLFQARLMGKPLGL